MSELDFDELDKAVNNLMSGVPKVEPPKTDDIKTLDIDSTLPDSSRPSLDQLDSALTAVNGTVKTDTPPATSSTSSTSSTAPLATRRAGRFMDVVHPSSDMKNASKPSASRQGVTIEPTKTIEQPTTPVDESPKEDTSVVNVLGEADTEPTSTMPDHDTHNENEWPDPLEMSGYHAKDETVTPQDEQTEPSPVHEDETEDDDDVFAIDDLEDTTPAPLTTPFLSDAKVEKRPLGGTVTDSIPAVEPSVSNAAAEQDDAAPADDPEDQLPALTADVAPILPPELQKDLMAIETDGGTSAMETPAAEVPATDSAEPAPVVESSNISVSKEKETEIEPEKPAVEAPVPAGPTSIPQQYKEEPSTSDQTNGGIYDTDTYHQPLAHPVKKKSGWLWIVWIVLLLIIGGGGAAALYWFHII